MQTNVLVPFHAMAIGTVTFSCGKEIMITEQSRNHTHGFEVLKRTKTYIEYGENSVQLPKNCMGYIRTVYSP